LSGEASHEYSAHSLNVYTWFLDASGEVLQQKLVYSSGYRNSAYVEKQSRFRKTLISPTKRWEYLSAIRLKYAGAVNNFRNSIIIEIDLFWVLEPLVLKHFAANPENDLREDYTRRNWLTTELEKGRQHDRTQEDQAGKYPFST